LRGAGGRDGGGLCSEREIERDRKRAKKRKRKRERERKCVWGCVWCVWREGHRESSVCGRARSNRERKHVRERGAGGQTGEEGGRGRNERVSGGLGMRQER
jgi:hypothetical protein